MTPEEMQAEIERLKQQVADNEAKVKTAASIQRAFNNLKDHNGQAAQYLEDLAAGRPATPFWEASHAVETDVDPDLDTAGALSQMEQRISAAVEAKVQGILGMLDSKFNAVANPVLEMRAKSAQANVQRDFDAKFGAGSFEKYRGKAAELAQGNESLLQNEAGLMALLKASIAEDAIEIGKQQKAAESERRTSLLDSVFGGPTPGGARGSDGTGFDDLDWTNNTVGALAEAAERIAQGG